MTPSDTQSMPSDTPSTPSDAPAPARDGGPGFDLLVWIPAIALLFSFVYARVLLPDTGFAAAATAAILFLISGALSFVIGLVGVWRRARGHAEPSPALLAVAFAPLVIVAALIVWPLLGG